MSIIDIKNLSFSYNKELVLENINLHVEQKEFLAIIGPNGGGKSTLLKLMLGFLKPQKGSIKLFEDEPSKVLSQIGYVPQNTNINTNFPIKVIEVVMMGHVGSKRAIVGYKKEEILCARESLSRVGMLEFENKKIGSLSGGQRQRVMIARALCAHPKMMFLDEPTSSIDVKGQREIYELLKELNKTMTIVVVSHDISVILEYASIVAHINKNLSYHDIKGQKRFYTKDEHFCEVELLQMLGEKNV
jgi:zinc transport system ATP-binding protein